MSSFAQDGTTGRSAGFQRRRPVPHCLGILARVPDSVPHRSVLGNLRSNGSTNRSSSRRQACSVWLLYCRLPGKKSLKDDEAGYELIVVDATESAIERPKKTKAVLQRQEKAAHFWRSSRD